MLSVAVAGPLPAHLAIGLDLSEQPLSTALEVRTRGGVVDLGRTPWSDDDPLVTLTRAAFIGKA